MQYPCPQECKSKKLSKSKHFSSEMTDTSVLVRQPQLNWLYPYILISKLKVTTSGGFFSQWLAFCFIQLVQSPLGWSVVLSKPIYEGGHQFLQTQDNETFTTGPNKAAHITKSWLCSTEEVSDVHNIFRTSLPSVMPLAMCSYSLCVSILTQNCRIIVGTVLWYFIHDADIYLTW